MPFVLTSVPAIRYARGAGSAVVPPHWELAGRRRAVRDGAASVSGWRKMMNVLQASPLRSTHRWTRTNGFARAVCALGAAALLAATGAPSLALAAGGGGGGGSLGGMSSSGSSTPSRPKSPEEIAQARYERGLGYRDKAIAAAERASKTTGNGWWAGRHARSAAKSWQYAIDAYEEAIEKKPSFYQAYSDLGYAQRKIGSYEASLTAYNKALELRSDYAPAIEYLGEAYLELNRLTESKDLYMRLVQLDRELASQLMQAMVTWVDTAKKDPAKTQGLAIEDVESFSTWVEERKALAEQVGDASSEAAW
jgi:tetratricopeptide (TPR) repeat protein